MKQYWLLAVLASLFFSSPSPGFMPPIHREVTLFTLSAMSASGPNGRVRFSTQRQSELAGEVVAVDKRHPFSSSYHFDNEALRASSTNIIGWTNTAVRCFATPDYSGYLSCVITQNPVQRVGEALHAIQDFYSHSNFVSLYPYGTLTMVYGWQFGKTTLLDPLPGDAFCDANDAGMLLSVGPAYRRNGPQKLTTGYFSVDDWTMSLGPCAACSQSQALPRKGKCQHGMGVPPDTSCSSPCTKGCKGINKDQPCEQAAADSCVEPPFSCWHGQERHYEARAAATAATSEYMQYLVQRISDINPVGVCRLFGLPDEECSPRPTPTTTPTPAPDTPRPTGTPNPTCGIPADCQVQAAFGVPPWDELQGTPPLVNGGIANCPATSDPFADAAACVTQEFGYDGRLFFRSDLGLDSTGSVPPSGYSVKPIVGFYLARCSAPYYIASFNDTYIRCSLWNSPLEPTSLPCEEPNGCNAAIPCGYSTAGRTYGSLFECGPRESCGGGLTCTASCTCQ